MSKIIIRDAKIEDAKYLVAIYDYYVINTAISFEYVTPSIDEFEKRMVNIIDKYPYLVIEKDDVIVGYAYANYLKQRQAYDKSCELTIYLNHQVQKSGLGKMLYNDLEKRLKQMGILNLYACIGYPIIDDQYLNKNSANFHQHLGFNKVGEFHNCGYKFGNWYNMIWMEKIIGIHQHNI